MITSFESDAGDGGNKTTNGTPKGIVSIHLADYGNKCSKHNNDGSVKSFESTANDGRTSDDDDVPITDTPGVISELENDNIDDNVVTGDNDDDDGDDDDNSDNEDMSDDDDDNSSQEDSVSVNNNINSTTNPSDATPPWMSLVAMADDDNDNNPNNYKDF